MVFDLLKVFLPSITAFWLGILMTPVLTYYLYRYKAWKKKAGKIALDGTEAQEFAKLREETETKTPRMGGIIIWASVAATTGVMWALAHVWPDTGAAKFDFLSRTQTWIPLTTLLLGGLVGLVNDILDVTSESGERGIRLSARLVFVSLLALFIGWWFYDKLDVTALGIPFNGEWEIGWLIIPFFILVSVSLYASGVIDGIDGLSGGVFASIFTAYAFIAYNQQQIDLAAFCATVVGALLAFLWFNVPPARFWMTETGSMGSPLPLPRLRFSQTPWGKERECLSCRLSLFFLLLPLLQMFFK